MYLVISSGRIKYFQAVLSLGSSLNGRKILVRGNHDKNYPMKTIFDEVYAAGKIIDLEQDGTIFYTNYFLANMTVSEDLPWPSTCMTMDTIGLDIINNFYRRPYYDVGVDANNSASVSLNVILSFFKNPPKTPPKIKCSNCGAQMKECVGKFGRFLGCTRFPKCNFTISLEIDR